MRYDFTDRVRKALAIARERAMELGHDYVGTEHILLGLLGTKHGSDGAGAILRALAVDPEDLGERIIGAVRPGKARAAGGSLPYTSRGKKALELAMAEARERGEGPVGTGHLLLGILRERRGIAAQVLTSAGVTLEDARVRLDDLRGGGGSSARKAGRPSHAEDVWFLEVDPGSGTPIYEQIIARIEEAVATGRLEAGERLPPIRQLAEELGIAPGTVARAYSELEERAVLKTEGARGTRVASRSSSAAEAEERAETLEGLLRPVVVAAYHLGATGEQLRKALDRAMKGIFGLLA